MVISEPSYNTDGNSGSLMLLLKALEAHQGAVFGFFLFVFICFIFADGDIWR